MILQTLKIAKDVVVDGPPILLLNSLRKKKMNTILEDYQYL